MMMHAHLCAALTVDVEPPTHLVPEVRQNLLQLQEGGPLAGNVAEAGRHRERIRHRHAYGEVGEVWMAGERLGRLGTAWRIGFSVADRVFVLLAAAHTRTHY